MISLEQLIILILFTYTMRNMNEKRLSNIDIESNKLENDLNNQMKSRLDSEVELRKSLEERDRRVVYDPLMPGERRMPRHQIPPKQLLENINYPTRGAPENFQYVGNLVNDEGKIIPLFGREEFPRSNRWEYYIVYNQGDRSDFGVKIPITGNRPIRELQEDDTIDVPYNKGNFVYKPFDINTIRYNPYVF